MAEDKKKKKAPKAPKWSLAFIWGGATWALNWFVIEAFVREVSTWEAFSAAFGAFIAGWFTGGLLGKFAKWGAGVYTMMVLGVIVGVAFTYGAVTCGAATWSRGIAAAPRNSATTTSERYLSCKVC